MNLIVACFVLNLFSGAFVVHCASPLLELKKALIAAELKAIENDLKRVDKVLQNSEAPKDAKEEARKRKAQLQADEKKLRSTKPADYKLPEKKSVVVLSANVSSICKFDAFINFEGLTRSGPFYHAVGWKEGVCNPTAKADRYKVEFYILRTRYYPFPSWYVFIDSIVPAEGKEKSATSKQ